MFGLDDSFHFSDKKVCRGALGMSLEYGGSPQAHVMAARAKSSVGTVSTKALHHAEKSKLPDRVYECGIKSDSMQ